MVNNIYGITRVADGQPGSQLLPTRVFKGIVDVTFNFNFASNTNEVVKIKITHDGKTLLAYQGSDIPTQFVHTLVPSNTQYMLGSNFQIIITYDNFVMYSFVAPVVIAQTSYYKTFDGMSVKNAQFIETTDNGDMLVVLKSVDGTIYNTILYSNEQAVVATAVVDTPILAALSADTTINPIETIDHYNIEVL